MNTRGVARTLVDGGLTLARWPLAGMISLLPGDDTGRRESARLSLDRIDASIRGAIGGMLADPVLSNDAQRRRTAAETRADAQNLRAAAERTADRADAELQERRRESAQQRQQAERQAEATRAQARQSASATPSRSVRLNAAAWKQPQGGRAARETIEKAAPKARLEALEAKDEALKEKEKALAARDEARRLRSAATRAKKARRNGGRNA